MSKTYFSWDKGEKYCKDCDRVHPLRNFRVKNHEREEDQSSRYGHVCKFCESQVAKKNQALKYLHKKKMVKKEFCPHCNSFIKSQGVERNEVNPRRSS